jgi:hypothetical protein
VLLGSGLALILWKVVLTHTHLWGPLGLHVGGSRGGDCLSAERSRDEEIANGARAYRSYGGSWPYYTGADFKRDGVRELGRVDQLCIRCERGLGKKKTTQRCHQIE